MYFIKIPFATTGDKTAIPQPTQVDHEVNFTDGYTPQYGLPITDPDVQKIERAKMNWLFNMITTVLRLWQTRGAPDFITTSDNGGTPFVYEINALVRYNDIVYRSIVTSNTALPTDPASWVALGAPPGPTQGGTGIMSYILGDTLYASATNVLSKLGGNTTTSKKYMSQTGNGTNSAAPVWDFITESIVVALSDETSNLTPGTSKFTFRMPYAFTLTGVKGSSNSPPLGSGLVIDINENGASIFSSNLVIDAGSTTSVGSASPVVISDANLGADSIITFDIDSVGSSSPGTGAKVTLIGHQ